MKPLRGIFPTFDSFYWYASPDGLPGLCRYDMHISRKKIFLRILFLRRRFTYRIGRFYG